QEYFVQPPEHAGHVAVNVAEAGAERMCLQLDLREIHGAHRGAAAEIIEHLAAPPPADTILRLLGRTTDVRGQDHVLETLQGALKAIRIRGRLDRKNIERGPGDVTVANRFRQR